MLKSMKGGVVSVALKRDIRGVVSKYVNIKNVTMKKISWVPSLFSLSFHFSHKIKIQ